MTPKAPKSYTEDQVQEALTQVLQGRPIRGTARSLGIPESTLRARLQGRESKRYGHEVQQKLSPDQEARLAT